MVTSSRQVSGLSGAYAEPRIWMCSWHCVCHATRVSSQVAYLIITVWIYLYEEGQAFGIIPLLWTSVARP